MLPSSMGGATENSAIWKTHLEALLNLPKTRHIGTFVNQNLNHDNINDRNNLM